MILVDGLPGAHKARQPISWGIPSSERYTLPPQDRENDMSFVGGMKLGRRMRLEKEAPPFQAVEMRQIGGISVQKGNVKRFFLKISIFFGPSPYLSKRAMVKK
jgi:hypothetical protein